MNGIIKKLSLVLLSGMLGSVAYGQDFDWRPLSTDSGNFELYQDNDNFKDRISGSTASGQIDYVTVGGTFRKYNGDNNGSGGIGDANSCEMKGGSDDWTKSFVRADIVGDQGGMLSRSPLPMFNAKDAKSSRTAYQEVPSTATVKAVYLYWTGSTALKRKDPNDPSKGVEALVDKQVKFGRVGGDQIDITAKDEYIWATAEPTFFVNNYYKTNASVGYGAFTVIDKDHNKKLFKEIKDHPNDDFVMNDLLLNNKSEACTNGVAFGGWGMYIVYEDTNRPYTSMQLYPGLTHNSVDAKTDYTVRDIAIPPGVANKVSKFSIMASEGDPVGRSSAPDKVVLNFKNRGLPSTQATLFSYARERTNFFKGLISYEEYAGMARPQLNSTNQRSYQYGGGIDFVTMDIGQLTSDKTYEITFVSDNAAIGEQYLINNIAFINNASATDLNITKDIENPQSPYKPNDQIYYTIKVNNVSSLKTPVSIGYGVQVVDTLPSELELDVSNARPMQVSYNGGTNFFTMIDSGSSSNLIDDGDGYYVSGQQITFSRIGGIDNKGGVYYADRSPYFGSTPKTNADPNYYPVVYRIPVKIKSGTSSNAIITNKAEVTSNKSYDTNPNNNKADKTISLSQPAVIEVEKSVKENVVLFAKDPNNSGYLANPDTLTYTITVKNTGGGSSNNVIVTDQLPASATYLAGSAEIATGSGTFAPLADPTITTNTTGQQLVWDNANLAGKLDLAANQTKDIRFKVTVVPPTSPTQQQLIVNKVNAKQGANGTPTQDKKVKTDVVFPVIQKYGRYKDPTNNTWSNFYDDQIPSQDPGTEIEYCIDFKNLGTKNATNFAINDIVPANSEIVPGSMGLYEDKNDNPRKPLVTATTITVAHNPAPPPQGSVMTAPPFVLGYGTNISPGADAPKGTICFTVKIK